MFCTSYRCKWLASANDDNSRRSIEQSFSEIPFPERFPAYSRSMLVDDSDNLWVEHFLAPGDSVRTWDVFDRDGQYVTSISTRVGLELKQIAGDDAIGIWTDSLDVESVRVYGLRRTR